MSGLRYTEEFRRDAVAQATERDYSVLEVSRQLEISSKAKGDHRLIGLLKQAWLESGCVYGFRKMHDRMHNGRGMGFNRNPVFRTHGMKIQRGQDRGAGGTGCLMPPNLQPIPGRPDMVRMMDHIARKPQHLLLKKRQYGHVGFCRNI